MRPFPSPLAGDVIVSHGALLTAVQSHEGGALTMTVLPVVPASPTVSPVGEIDDTQAGGGADTAAAWLTVTVCPAIVSVPARCAPVLGATVKVTDPLPDCLPSAVIVIQSAAVAAVQVQPEAVETLNGAPAPPTAPIDCCDGDT